MVNFISSGLGRLKGDFRAMVGDVQALFPRGWEAALVALLVVLAAAMRVLILSRPMNHDEAYSYLAFASQGFYRTITDYHLPNNHIFHTLLVLLSTSLFGGEPWAIRLPALVTGITTVAVIYLAVRSVFRSSPAAVVAAGLAAFHPEMIRTSTEGRGYPLIALFTLTLWGLANYLAKKNNWIAWISFVGVGALGFYTVPSMLYPFGMIMVWLFYLWIRNEFSDAYTKAGFIGALIGSGLGVVALTNFLYLPVYLQIGFQQFMRNMVTGEMEPKPYPEFFEQLMARIEVAWVRWQDGVLPVMMVLLLLGFLFALYSRRTYRQQAAFVGLGTLWILAVLAVQQYVPWVRVWSFALPLYFAFAAVGLVDLVEKLRANANLQKLILVSIIVVFGVGTASWLLADSYKMRTWRGQPGDVEQVVQFLAQDIMPQDVVVVVAPDGPMIRYYFLAQGLPFDHFRMNRDDLETAYIIVNTADAQTVEFVIKKRGVIGDRLDYDTNRLVFENETITVYAIQIK